MNKNDIFAFIAPDGVEVTAVVLKSFMYYRDDKGKFIIENICYAQNKLFTYMQKGHSGFDADWKMSIDALYYGEVIVDYCVIPKYDIMIEDWQHQFDAADDYADREL